MARSIADRGGEPLLELCGVSKLYVEGDEQVRALEGVSFGLASGEFLLVGGPSGSGKTTLLLVASGIEAPDQGAVHFRGRDLASFSRRDKRRFRQRELGFVMQSPNLMPGLTALQNAAMPLLFDGMDKDEAEERAALMLTMLGLRGRLGHTDDKLSGGQKQRVAVARALAAGPSLVFADEPTGNLDSDSGAQVLGMLRDAAAEADASVILVSHDPASAQYADRQVRIQDGRLINLAS